MKQSVCVSCGYNMHGLSAGMRCPECGGTRRYVPTGGSSRDVLSGCGPARRMRWRAGFLLAAAALIALLILVFERLWSIAVVSGLTAGPILQHLILIAAGGLWCIAAWLLTPALDSGAWPAYGRIRWFLRSGGIFLGVMPVYVPFLPPSLTTLILLPLLYGGIATSLLVRHVSRIALEAERMRTARRLALLSWLLPLLSALFFPAFFSSQCLALFLLLLWLSCMVFCIKGFLDLALHVYWIDAYLRRTAGREQRIEQRRAAIDTEARQGSRVQSQPCPHCGYDLRFRVPGDPCPECGQ